MKTKVTSHDVARLANVSQSAVSRAFTPGASVAAETRERIHVAARTLGYRPNAIARSLITRRSRIIGLVMSHLENQFYACMVERLCQSLREDGYHVLLFMNDAPNADSILSEILQYQVDGIVLASTTVSCALANDCKSAGIPVVMFNRVAQRGALGSYATSSVTSRNREGGRLVGEMLVQTGHRRIAWLAGREDVSTSLDRESGLCETLVQAGLNLHAKAVGQFDFVQTQKAVTALFTHSRTQPDALFVANDFMAIAALQTLRNILGLRVPEDVSVVGFDNIPQAAWPVFSLTTVEQDIDQMLQATRNLLFEQMGAEVVPRSVTIACKLVQRSTVALRSPIAPCVASHSTQEIAPCT